MIQKYASIVETLELDAAREWGAAAGGRAAGVPMYVQGIVIQNTTASADQVEFEYADTDAAWFTIDVPANSIANIEIPFQAGRGIRAALAAAGVFVTVFYNAE